MYCPVGGTVRYGVAGCVLCHPLTAAGEGCVPPVFECTAAGGQRCRLVNPQGGWSTAVKTRKVPRGARVRLAGAQDATHVHMAQVEGVGCGYPPLAVVLLLLPSVHAPARRCSSNLPTSSSRIFCLQQCRAAAAEVNAAARVGSRAAHLCCCFEARSVSGVSSHPASECVLPVCQCVAPVLLLQQQTHCGSGVGKVGGWVVSRPNGLTERALTS